MNTKKPLFQKIFSRDFSLAALEIFYICESSPHKPWLPHANPHHPYLVFERVDGTVHIYYNREGMKWTNEVLKKLVQKEPHFLNIVEDKCLKGISFIQPTYEQEQLLSKNKLISFLDEFRLAYPWIEAMWWLNKMTSQELNADNSNLQRVREMTDKLSAGTDSVIRKSFSKIYPKLGSFAAMIRLEEIRSGKIPLKEELERRDQGFFYTDEKLFVGFTCEQIEKKYNLTLESVKVEKDTTILKGECASPGLVVGKVYKIMGHHDFHKIKPSGILVSPMTMPDFIMAMEKAAAVVTDEGGMLCHAAIIAREMKKPCVTGTKIATAVLKDGDLVEVDATNGIVKIIKKAT